MFQPKTGMITSDSYLHGAGDRDSIGCKGVIEHVGKDYFILRIIDENKPVMIHEESYWCIEKDDFS